MKKLILIITILSAFATSTAFAKCVAIFIDGDLTQCCCDDDVCNCV